MLLESIDVVIGSGWTNRLQGPKLCNSQRQKQQTQQSDCICMSNSLVHRGCDPFRKEMVTAVNLRIDLNVQGTRSGSGLGLIDDANSCLLSYP